MDWKIAGIVTINATVLVFCGLLNHQKSIEILINLIEMLAIQLISQAWINKIFERFEN
ncbi:hypothetical protein [Nostoc linckia]|uniref:hypothetical protein n=1 Tax=Nostoc linckia TaxID=92942 RepID=UPI0015D47007|nr:hypothetical protein [Nostoc linckia]